MGTGGDTFQLPPAAGGTPTAQAKAPLTLCTRWLGVESGRPTSPLGRLCCASPALAPGEEEGIAGEAPRSAGSLSPTPQKAQAASTSHSTSPPREQEEGGRARLGGYLVSTSPGGLWGTSQERCRHICRSTS